MSEQLTSQPGPLNYAQAAARLGVSARTVRRWVAERRLRACRPTKRTVVIRESDIEIMLSRKATIAY